MKKRKLALAKELREELEWLPENSMFGENNKLKDYDRAIEYLEKGVVPINYEGSDLLSSVMDDFETMCADYGV